MTTPNAKEALELLEKLGITPDVLAAAAGLANVAVAARQHAVFEVTINEEGDRKYGDVTIYKVQGNGFRAPKVGIYADDLPGLINQLQAAQKKVTTS